MASSSSDPKSNPRPALPLYFYGIPKDIGKKKEEPKEKPLDPYSASILANFERNKKAAKEKRLADEAAQRKATEAAAARKEEERREAEAQKGRRMLGLDKPPQSTTRRRSGASTSKRPPLGGASSKRGAITKRKGGSSRGKRSRKNDDSDDDGPTPMHKGMEIVREKKREKGPVVRNTSDYSELFGDTYLLGADVEITRELAETSRAETERVRAALRKEKEEKERVRRESIKFDREKLRMERSGELKTKKGREKLGMLRKKLHADKYEVVGDATRPAASQSLSIPKKKANGKATPSGSIEERKARLLARLGATLPESEKPPYERRSPPQRKSRPPPVPSVSRRGRYRDVVDSDEEEPPRRKRYRRDVVDSDEEESPRRQRYRNDDPPRRKRPRDVVDSDDDDFAYRKKKTAKKRERSYFSDTSEDEADDYDDGNRGFGGNFETSFEEVELEERKSAYYGKMEDRKEKKKLDKLKQEKKIRRRAAGLDSESEEEDEIE